MGVGASKEEKMMRHAQRGEIDQLCSLLDEGADPNYRDAEGNTALHMACSEDQVHCLKVLLARKANPAVGDAYGFTPLHRAVQGDCVQCVQELLKRDDGVRLVNLTNNHGTTPLHWAAVWCSTSCAKLLIEAGADRNAQQRNGQTPLHLAASNHSTDIVHSLLAAGANTTVQDNYGATAEDMAESKQLKEIIQSGGDKAIAARPVWTPDYASELCTACGEEFTLINRRHHCRKCGRVFCGDCSSRKGEVPHMGFSGKVRLCEACYRATEDSGGGGDGDTSEGAAGAAASSTTAGAGDAE